MTDCVKCWCDAFLQSKGIYSSSIFYCLKIGLLKKDMLCLGLGEAQQKWSVITFCIVNIESWTIHGKGEIQGHRKCLVVYKYKRAHGPTDHSGHRPSAIRDGGCVSTRGVDVNRPTRFCSLGLRLRKGRQQWRLLGCPQPRRSRRPRPRSWTGATASRSPLSTRRWPWTSVSDSWRLHIWKSFTMIDFMIQIFELLNLDDDWGWMVSMMMSPESRVPSRTANSDIAEDKLQAESRATLAED